MDDLTYDAELLVNYAITHKVPLPNGCAATLSAAKGQAAALALPGSLRDNFYSAFNAAATAVAVSVASLRSSAERCSRLRVAVVDAQRLLEYAASSGLKIDDEIRNPLIAAADAVEMGTPAVADEQAFFKAYEALTAKTTPVTAETLEASKTKLPDFFSKGGFASALTGVTLGRFFDAMVFLFVLLMCCMSLSYYALGKVSLKRYAELPATLNELDGKLAQHRDLLTMRLVAQTRPNDSGKLDPGAAAGLALAVTQAKTLVLDEDDAIQQMRKEQIAIPQRLWQWAQLPCSDDAWFMFRWTMCSVIDKAAKNAPPPSDIEKIEAAKTMAARYSDIYLPLLLGLLGSHAFVLRNMIRDISANSFAKSSALRHIVRLGLGALAGLASTWLLTAEAVGGATLKNIPVWALAFVAGYGIELVFSFMDRIIAAFATKTA